MKKILPVLLLTVFSFSSFANILEESATNDEIRDAIIVSLQENDLNCVNQVNNRTMKASALNIVQIFSENYTVHLSADGSQPVITMERLGAGNNPKNKNVLMVTTDKSLKMVTRLDIKSYDNVTKVRVNVGTILNPIFKEELRDGKAFEDIVCTQKI